MKEKITVERSMAKKIAGVLLALAVGGLIFLFTRSYGIGFPISESVGDNIYLLEKNNHNYQKGDLVSFSYRGGDFREYKAGDKFLKFAGCVAGDTLRVEGQSYFCNDKLIGRAVLSDSTGKPMNQFIYNGVIPKGSFFALGTHLKSYDSRYWGFVQDRHIYAKATKVF